MTDNNSAVKLQLAVIVNVKNWNQLKPQIEIQIWIKITASVGNKIHLD